MASFYWIKLYDDILDDPKMGRLSDGAYRLCINLFLLAGKGDIRDGRLPSFEDISWTLRLPLDLLSKQWNELEQSGIVNRIDDQLFVKNFRKRQSAITPAEKQRLYRDRKRGEALHGSDEYVTEAVTKSNADTDIDKELEEELEKESGGGGVYALFENEIGTISRVMSQTLDTAIEDYGSQWVEDAIKESVLNGVRKWKYIEAILNRWKADGRFKQSVNGTSTVKRNSDGSYNL